MIELPPPEYLGQVRDVRDDKGNVATVDAGAWADPHYEYEICRQWLDAYADIWEMAVDTETTGLKIGPGQDEAVFWSMSDGYRRWTIPRRLLHYFKDYLEDPRRLIIMHKGNYDTHILRNSGVDLFRYHTGEQGRRWHRRHCTMIGHTLVSEYEPHTLKFCGPDLICTRKGIPKFSMPAFAKIFPGCKEADTGEVLMAAMVDPAMFLKAHDYASQDAWVTMRLYWEVKKFLQAAPLPPWPHSRFGWLMHNDPYGAYTLWDYYLEIEMAMMDVCYAMEREGVLIDQQVLADMRAPFLEEIEMATRAVAGALGRVINPNSDHQIRWAMFAKDELLPYPEDKKTLAKYKKHAFIDQRWGRNDQGTEVDYWVKEGGPFQLEPIKMTDGGKSGVKVPSVNAEVLEELANHKVQMPDGEWVQSRVGAVAENTLTVRSLKKLISTYIDGIMERLTGDGYVHTTFNQQVARTGRLSSSDPNLQNIPARDDRAARLRTAFLPPPGYYFIDADYSQVEPRITACLSGDKSLVEAILSGMDVHSMTAAEMFKVPYEWVDGAKTLHDEGRDAEFPGAFPDCAHAVKELLFFRRAAKEIRLGLTYGMGAKLLAKKLRIVVKEAKGHVKRFWEVSAGVRIWFDDLIVKAEETGQCFSFLGRRRWNINIHSPEWGARGLGERVAQNTAVQASAADIIKKAQIELYYDNELWEAGIRQVLQVHDEVVFIVPLTVPYEWARDRIQHRMENPFLHPTLQLPDGRVIPTPADPHWGMTWAAAK
jgi:DNA polymerase I-like protein with 3'-5' exonuclease and polymerase domains